VLAKLNMMGMLKYALQKCKLLSLYLLYPLHNIPHSLRLAGTKMQSPEGDIIYYFISEARQRKSPRQQECRGLATVIDSWKS